MRKVVTAQAIQPRRTVREIDAAERNPERDSKSSPKTLTKGRVPIPAGIKHEVTIKNAHQRTYQEPRTQLRCEKERFLLPSFKPALLGLH